MLGQTWQEAGRRRCWKTQTLWSALPTSDRSGGNYLGSTAETPLLSEPAIEHEGAFVHDAGVSEVLVIHEPVETAFPLHTRIVSQLFAPCNPI